MDGEQFGSDLASAIKFALRKLFRRKPDPEPVFVLPPGTYYLAPGQHTFTGPIRLSPGTTMTGMTYLYNLDREFKPKEDQS